MKSTRVLYTVLAVQSAILAYLVIGAAQPTAVGQVPDQGAQLQQIVEESKAMNVKMDRLINVLESGKLQVRVVEK